MGCHRLEQQTRSHSAEDATLWSQRGKDKALPVSRTDFQVLHGHSAIMVQARLPHPNLSALNPRVGGVFFVFLSSLGEGGGIERCRGAPAWPSGRQRHRQQ